MKKDLQLRTQQAVDFKAIEGIKINKSKVLGPMEKRRLEELINKAINRRNLDEQSRRTEIRKTTVK